MSREHVSDGQATFDRIGAACDRIGAAGYPDVATAIAGHTRERRGQIQKGVLALRVGTHLLALADQAEGLAAALDDSQEGTP